MTVFAVLVYVVFPGLVVCSSILALAALIYLPPTGERCEHAAWMLALPAWGLVATNRFSWIVRILRDGDLWAGLQVTTWTTATMLFMACGAAVGVATAWRERDVLGHFALLFVSIAYIAWQLFDVEMIQIGALVAAIPTRGVIVLLDAEIQVLLLSMVTVGLSTAHLARGGNEPGVTKAGMVIVRAKWRRNHLSRDSLSMAHLHLRVRRAGAVPRRVLECMPRREC